jgi:hypothetical protein
VERGRILSSDQTPAQNPSRRREYKSVLSICDGRNGRVGRGESTSARSPTDVPSLISTEKVDAQGGFFADDPILLVPFLSRVWHTLDQSVLQIPPVPNPPQKAEQTLGPRHFSLQCTVDDESAI